MNIKNIPYMKNYISFNLTDNMVRKGKVKISQSAINDASKTLVYCFLEYFKKGGDIENLTPENVFRKK